MAQGSEWGLPIAPAVMALGALLTHELDPQQLRHRAQSAEQLAFTEDQFAAQMAAMRAEMAAAKTLKNMQLNARMSAAKQIAAWYSSDEAQRAITATALQNAPALLRAIGVEFEGPNAVIPGETAGNDRGQNDASHSNEKPLSEHEIADWLARYPEAAATILGLVWPDRVDDRVTAEGENGTYPTRPRPASDGRGTEG